MQISFYNTINCNQEKGDTTVIASYHYCKPFISKLFGNSEGQTVTEYVMILVLVAIAAFVVSPSITDAVVGVYQGTNSMLVEGMAS